MIRISKELFYNSLNKLGLLIWHTTQIGTFCLMLYGIYGITIGNYDIALVGVIFGGFFTIMFILVQREDYFLFILNRKLKLFGWKEIQ